MQALLAVVQREQDRLADDDELPRKVLLCYDEGDKATARRLLRGLEAEGIDVAELTNKEVTWYTQCQEECGMCIPLLSEGFVRSDGCEGKLLYARYCELAIVQVPACCIL